MGTVGLSFGSPTSGAGFNVSSTVAAIVANLQNVETPWKTQLASLDTQDTAISSLGTLLSSLSNDVSALTDFQGILAEKSGSSSDQNVLTLTAANSTANAGTHSVTVTNLAQTSSGYLAEVPSASTALTGSITLQDATGKAVTIALNSSNNSLSGLAATINSSGVGITASVLTEASGSILSLVSGTSGAAGNITVSNNSLAAYLNAASTASTSGANASATVGEIAKSTDTLSGSMSIQVGSGTVENVVIGAAPDSPAANTIYTGSGINTLSGVEGAINAAGIGVTASLVTNGDGTESLSLLSGTAGTAGALSVTSSLLDTSASALGYTASVTGKDANLTVDGIELTSASNTVANLIPGVTFQLLAPSATESNNTLEQVQVVIANDNAQVESTVSQFVSDYNALVSGINTQEGNTSSGTPEPLFGSPTLSLLQQQLLSGLNASNPNGSLTSIAEGAGTSLSGSLSIQVGGGSLEHVVIGAAPGSPAANTIYTGSGSGFNTLAGLAGTINSANLGVTASVATLNGQSTLSFLSGTEGSAGTLTLTSDLMATSEAQLSFSGTPGEDATSSAPATNSSGLLTALSGANDPLAGALTIEVGTGQKQTIAVPANNTLAGLEAAINAGNYGVTASIAIDPASGASSLQLLSNTPGSAGTLTVTSSLLDTSNTSTSTVSYTNASDITSLTALGISVNNDGTIALDATSLDSLLNSDYSGVVGFFQNASGWGQTFSTMLTDSGTTQGSGVLALASTSNSNIEATLNADISKENSHISAQQTSLTAELNSANEIMQELPTQLAGVNELYSAITGYNQQQVG